MKKILWGLVFLILIIKIFSVLYPQKITDIRNYFTSSQDKQDTQLLIDEKFLTASSISSGEISDGVQQPLPKQDLDDWLSPQFWRNATVFDVQQKIEEGSDVQTRNTHGATILMFAVSLTDNPWVIDALLDKGAPLNTRDENGRNALMFAATFNSNPQVIDLLIKRGADIHSVDKNGWSPLMFAASRNTNPEIIETLIKDGADVNGRIPRLDTQLSRASLSQKLVLSIKIGLDTSKDFFNSLISSPKEIQNHNIFDLFSNSIDKMSDKILGAETGMTALMIAARDSSSPQILDELLSNNADAKLYDDKGKNALDYAKDNQAISGTPIYWKINDLLY